MSKRALSSFLAVITVLGACSVSFANGNTAKARNLPVRLDEAIDVALHNRLDVAIASRQRARAGIQTNVVNQNFLPHIALSGSSRHIRSLDKFSGIEADARLGDQTFHVTVEKDLPAYEATAGLDFTYNIYAGGRDVAGLDEAMALQTAQQYEETVTRVNVALEVMKAYWSLRKSQIVSRIAERAYLHATKLLLIAEAKKSSGLVSEIEAEAEALYVKETVLAVANARNDEARNLAKYRMSLGYRSAPQPSAGGSLPLIDDPEAISEVAVMPAADRPETRRLKAETMAAEARVRQSQAAALPTVDFFANYKMVGRDDDYFGSTRLRSDYYTVGVTVSLSLFDGFKERIALAASEEEIARLRAEWSIRQLEAQSNDMIMEKEKLQKELMFAEERLKLYEKKKQLAAESFSNGAISKIEFLAAEKEYEDFADKFLLSKIDVAVANQSLSIVNKTN